MSLIYLRRSGGKRNKYEEMNDKKRTKALHSKKHYMKENNTPSES
jgi:hypothetical protein